MDQDWCMAFTVINHTGASWGAWIWWVHHADSKIRTVPFDCTFFVAWERSGIEQVVIALLTHTGVCESRGRVARAASTISPVAGIKNWEVGSVGIGRRSRSSSTVEIECTVGNHARQEVEKLIIVGTSLFPPFLAFAFKSKSVVTRSHAASLSTNICLARFITEEWEGEVGGGIGRCESECNSEKSSVLNCRHVQKQERKNAVQ